MDSLVDELNNLGGHKRGIKPMEDRKSSDGAYDNKRLDEEGAPRHARERAWTRPHPSRGTRRGAFLGVRGSMQRASSLFVPRRVTLHAA